LRMRPGEDLLGSIKSLVRQRGIREGVILSLIGTLRAVQVRYYLGPEGQRVVKRSGHYELVNGSGIFFTDQEDVFVHAHFEVSSLSETLGGHLVEGNIVDVVALAVVAEVEDADLKSLVKS